jgi:hypothetical protein
VRLHPAAARELVEVVAGIDGAVEGIEIDARSARHRLSLRLLRIERRVRQCDEKGGWKNDYPEGSAACHHGEKLLEW